jgi:hypothetical protein
VPAKSRSEGAPAEGPEPLRRSEEAVSQKRVQLRHIGGNQSGLLESHDKVTLNVVLHVEATVS